MAPSSEIRRLTLVKPNDPRFFGPITRLGLGTNQISVRSRLIFLISQVILLSSMAYYFFF